MYRLKLTADDFDTNTVQSRFIAYLQAHNLKPGDTWTTYEFMSWSSAMTDEFRQDRGLSEGEHINQSELTSWVKEKVDSK